MAEDNPAAPLPRRLPGSNRHGPGGREGPVNGPVGPAALPEDVLQRIRDALGSLREEASPEHAARAERPASLPRRVPGASKGPGPPAVIARPRLPSLPPALPRSRTDEAATGPAPSVSPAGGHTEEITARPDANTEEITARPDANTEEITARPDANTEEITARPDANTEEITARPDANTEEITARPDANTEEITARPGPGKAAPAGSRLAPVPRRREAERPDRHDQTDGETGHREKAPGHQENGQARRAKRPARRAKAPGRRAKASARAAKPAPPKRPSRPRKPAPQKAPAHPGEPEPRMAPLFPEESAPEQATVPSPAPLWPQRARSGRLIGWLILVIALISAGSLALLLAR